MKILILDNYDSFTYNLYYLVKQIVSEDTQIDVFRNDAISIDQLNIYDKIILSPGPGIPKEAGILISLIKTYAPSKSILGVCLGEQAIAEAFGGQLMNLPDGCHGIATPIEICDSDNSLFTGITELSAGRYHSWVVDRTHLPDCLQVTAEDDLGFIMGLRHKTYDVQGIQFHPESILTPDGHIILKNWLASQKPSSQHNKTN